LDTALSADCITLGAAQMDARMILDCLAKLQERCRAPISVHVQFLLDLRFQ